jgi:hypothetical protein
MRKLLTILLTVLATALVLVGCSMESKVEDGLALLSFKVSENSLTSKSLTRTNPVLDTEEFYWFYTATKTDGTGLVAGATSTEKAVDAGNKGLDTVGPFSYGDWEFTLYGYAGIEDGKGVNLAYSGTEKLTVKKSTNDLVITVESKQTATGVGYLDFPAKGSIALTGDYDSSKVVYSKFVEKIEIKRLDDSNQTDIILYEYSDNSGVNGLRRKQLTSGSYSVTFSYLQGATKQGNGLYEGGYAVAQEMLYVAIADYLTTTIGGDISSNTGEVKITVKNGIVEVQSKPVTVNTQGVTTIPVQAAPVSKDATGEEEGAPSTSIAIPAGAISGTKVTASTTSYTREAASSLKATFTIVDESGSGDGTQAGGAGDGTQAGGTGAVPTTTEAVVLGGLDIDLYVDNSTEKATDFAGDNALTITTYIAKGLNGGLDYEDKDADGLGDTSTASAGKKCDIAIKYDGPAGEDGKPKSDGKVVSYNATSGQLVFTVDHLSTYYFVSLNAVVYNENKLVAYDSLAAAIGAADSGDKLTVLKDIAFGESDTIKVDKSLTLDLGGKTITASKNRVFWVHNGTLTIDNGTIEATVDSSTSSAIRVSCDRKDACASCKGENLGLVLMANATVKAPNSYGISAFGNLDATVDIYGTVESLNACVASSGTAERVGKFVFNIHQGASLTATGDLEITKGDSCAIYQPDGDTTLNIYGGTITSNSFSAVEIRAGKANISGGTLKSLGTYGSAANGNGPSTKGVALAMSLHSKCDNTKNGISVVLSGDVKLEAEKQLAVLNLQANQLNGDEITKVKVVVDEVTLDESKVVGYKGVSGNYYFDATCALANDEAVAKVGDTYYVSLSEAIEAGKKAADAGAGEASGDSAGGGSKTIEVEVLKEVTLTGVPSDYTLSLVGKDKDETVVHVNSSVNNYESGGAIYGANYALKFKNVTVDFGVFANYKGFIRATDLIFEDCNITGMGSYWGIGDVTFKNCVFKDYNEGKDSATAGFENYVYNMWLYSGLNFVFEDCTFYSSNGKFINVYIEQVNGDIKVSMTRCSFIAGKDTGTGEVEKKTALKVMKLGNWDINLTSCTTDQYVKDGTRTGSKLYNVLEEDVSTNTKITIDGVVVWENGAKVETSATAQ